MNIKKNKSSITINRNKNLKQINILTKPYPGFPTDLQARGYSCEHFDHQGASSSTRDSIAELMGFVADQRGGKTSKDVPVSEYPQGSEHFSLGPVQSVNVERPSWEVAVSHERSVASSQIVDPSFPSASSLTFDSS